MRNTLFIVCISFLVICGCSKERTSITGIVYPERRLAVNDSAELSLMLASPAGDEIVLWQPTIGKCESINKHSLSCRYFAQRAGEDTVIVEVLRDRRVVAKTSIKINVTGNDSSSSPPSAGPGQSQDTTDSLQADIVVTKKPPFGQGSPETTFPIEGMLSSVANPERLGLVIYAYDEGVQLWYVQPWKNAWLTTIDQDGSWATKTHPGTEYAILLVNSSYTNTPAQTNQLPRGGAVLKTLRLRNRE